MTSSASSAVRADQPQEAGNEPVDPHYLRDVTALGDSLEIRARKAIWSKSRIKLVDRGVRIDSRLYERLMQFRLQPAIEESLEIADAVSAADLRRETIRLLESDSGYASLRELAASPEEMLSVMGQMPIDHGLAVRLTVMRERRPAMYAHAVGVAALAVCLAGKAGIAGDRLRRAAAAGIYHDIGEMHVDPQLLGTARSLAESERRHIYTHPLTAYFVLQEHDCCSGGVADAVLEHHERVDGSGYPRGIRGEELGQLGRVLSLAEMAAAFFAPKLASGALQRMRVVLRLNHRRLDAALTDTLIDLLQKAAPGQPAGDPGESAAVIAKVEVILAVVEDWRQLRAGGGGDGAAFHWTAERMRDLERGLLEAGLGGVDAAALAGVIEQDETACRELAAVARELGWLLQEVVNGVYRDPAVVPGEGLAQWASRTRQKLAA
ncbi:MAG: HD domain-containing protein [Burkholderiales bacterium]|nr:HD domain-containing protein [Burkholderiales bacterium]